MSKNLMYDFVSVTRPNPLGGSCYNCIYCYIHGLKGWKNRFEHIRKKYSGDFKLYPHILKVIRNLKTDRDVFFCDCIDYLHKDNSDENILEIWEAIEENHKVSFISLTKNSRRYLELRKDIPFNLIIGSTITSNRDYPEYENDALPNSERIKAMIDIANDIRLYLLPRFVSIEPILKFDFDDFLNNLEFINPTYGIALGFDNHRNKLKEPSLKDVMALRTKLISYGIRIFDKSLRIAWWEK